LEVAKALRGGGYHEWACFASQQAAEKAVRALAQRLGAELRTHAITRAVGELGAPARGADAAARLDRLYVPTRYPDVLDEGAPKDVYLDGDSRQAIDDAVTVMEWCGARLS
jgi:HEPN domain-containing protein